MVHRYGNQEVHRYDTIREEYAALQRQEQGLNLVIVYDCTSSKYGSFAVPPSAQMAGYGTGSGGVPWTAEQWAAHPHAVRFDQAPADTPANETMDVLDVEQLAATLADIPQWVHEAWGSYHAAARPGQRTPAIYMSQSNLTPVANTLNAAGITSGVGLWLAEEMDQAHAANIVQQASGPFPIIGVQFAFMGNYDISVVSADWFNNVSRKAPEPVGRPGTQSGWAVCVKCTCLFAADSQVIGACAAGGVHDDRNSHNYQLVFIA